MKSTKTTAAGILAIVGALVTAGQQWAAGGFATINWTATATAISAGVGLIMARDNNKTSEDVGAK